MDEAKVRKWVHDLNNRVGAVLNTAELLQLEKLTPKALERAKVIEEKTLEIRQLIRDMTEHLLG
jgi:signal transduction histidine kinase